MVKRSSDPRSGSLTPKSNFRYFTPLGAGTRGNFVLSRPRREMGTGAAVRHGRSRQTSEPGPFWDCRRVLWVPGPWGQYSGKIRLIKKHGVQDEVGRHVDKSSSDPRQAYPEVKLQGRELVRVVGIVAPLSHWGPEPRENSFYRA